MPAAATRPGRSPAAPRRGAALVGVAALALLLAACQPNAEPSAALAAPASVPTASVAPRPRADSPAARRIRATVGVLAADRFAGRETGSRGHQLAANAVAARLRALGLQPAGDDGGYFQHVPLLRSVRERDGATLVVHRNGRDIALRFGTQFLPAAGFHAATTTLTAPAVFVNQGVVAPALGRDDLAGLELAGRIAVLFRGVPAAFDDDQRALHGRDEDKLRRLAARGAIGVVLINSALDEASVPWANIAAAWDKPAMQLRAADGTPLDGLPSLRVVANVSAAAADLLFADQPQSAAELFIQARNGTGHGFALPGTLTLSAHNRISALEARNVIARVPGTETALRDAPVVISAHLDHLGNGPALGGDSIYNGAIDNALGVAIALEAASEAVAAGPRKRPLLLLATTGEEQGLLGARWFATHPPGAGAVADINIDMPVLTAPTTDVVAIGAEHSSLRPVLDAAAGRVGVAVSPDPYPEDDTLVRGDHYAFIRAGIPALYLGGGTIAADKSRDPKIALRYYLRNCYHRPCDDASQPIQYDDAARLATLAARIAGAVADRAEPPAWNAGDAFGARFAGPPAD